MTENYSQGYAIHSMGTNIHQIVAGCFSDVVGGDNQARANAAFIVRAVNSHAALVSALESIVSGDPHGGTYSGSQCVDIARAALAAAKGE